MRERCVSTENQHYRIEHQTCSQHNVTFDVTIVFVLSSIFVRLYITSLSCYLFVLENDTISIETLKICLFSEENKYPRKAMFLDPQR